MISLFKDILNWIAPLYLLVWLVGIAVYFIAKNETCLNCIPKYLLYFAGNNWFERIPKLVPPALLALAFAYIGFNKFDYFQHFSTLYNLSDRCLASNIKLDDPRGVSYPILINQGGDPWAYEALLKMYEQAKDKIVKDGIKAQLTRIFDNISSTENFFRENYVMISRTGNGNWTYSQPSPFEFWNEYDVGNIIEQLGHPTYWTTRVSSAKFLQNMEYLRDKKGFRQENAINMMNIKAEVLLQNLVNNMKDSSSLLVRKSSLDTFKKLICDGRAQECGMEFVFENIYYFDKAVSYGQEHKPQILKTFNKIIAANLKS